MVLAVIRRGGQNGRGEPRLDWLKGTSQVGYDAGCVLLLMRDRDRDERFGGDRHIQAWVLKNRHGQSGGCARVAFNGGRNMFRSDSDEED